MKMRQTKRKVPFSKMTRFELADHVILKQLAHDWRPTGKELRKYLGVSQQRFQAIKQAARTSVAPDRYGLVWGYHEPTNTYRLANDDSRVGVEIISYYVRSAADEILGLIPMIKAAEAGGMITSESAERAVKEIDKLYSDVMHVAIDLYLQSLGTWESE